MGDRSFKESLRQNEKKLFRSLKRVNNKNDGSAFGSSRYQNQFEVDITQYRNWITPKEQMKIINKIR